MGKLDKGLLKNIRNNIQNTKEDLQKQKDSVMTVDESILNLDLGNEEEETVMKNKIDWNEGLSEDNEESILSGEGGLVIPDFGDDDDDNDMNLDFTDSNKTEEVSTMNDIPEELNFDVEESKPKEEEEEDIELKFDDNVTVDDSAEVNIVETHVEDVEDDLDIVSLSEDELIPEMPSVEGDSSKISEMLDLIQEFKDKLTANQITDLTTKAKEGIDVTQSLEDMLKLNEDIVFTDASTEPEVEESRPIEEQEKDLQEAREAGATVVDIDNGEVIETRNVEVEANKVLKSIVAVDGKVYTPTIDRQALKSRLTGLNKVVHDTIDKDFRNYRIVKRRLDKILAESGEIAIAVKSSEIDVNDKVLEILKSNNLPTEKFAEGFIVSFRTLSDEEKGYRTGLQRFIEELETTMSDKLPKGEVAEISLLDGGLPRLTEEELNELLSDLSEFEIKILDDATMRLDIKDI